MALPPLPSLVVAFVADRGRLTTGALLIALTGVGCTNFGGAMHDMNRNLQQSFAGNGSAAKKADAKPEGKSASRAKERTKERAKKSAGEETQLARVKKSSAREGAQPARDRIGTRADNLTVAAGTLAGEDVAAEVDRQRQKLDAAVEAKIQDADAKIEARKQQIADAEAKVDAQVAQVDALETRLINEGQLAQAEYDRTRGELETALKDNKREMETTKREIAALNAELKASAASGDSKRTAEDSARYRVLLTQKRDAQQAQYERLGQVNARLVTQRNRVLELGKAKRPAAVPGAADKAS